MKAVYENDTAKGQGYGRVRLSDLPPDVDVAASGWTYALLRASDQKSLHPAGWEDTACRLTPDAVHTAGSEVLLDIDPTVVCQLDELNTYRLMVYPPAGSPLKAVLELSGIVYPAEHASGGISVPAKALAKPAVKPAPQPVPEPEPQPQPEVPAEPLSLTPAQPPAAKPAAGGVVRVLAVVLLLLLAGGAGAWYLLKQETAPEQALAEAKPETPAAESAAESSGEAPKPETPAPAEDPKPADPPQAEATPAVPQAPAAPATPPAPAAPPVSVAPLEQARQFLRGSGAPADGLALSRTLPETPDGRDAAFLLLEAAAEQGLPDAMLDLGAFYDPSRTLARGSIQPDPEQAWLWYGKAAAAGQAEATSRRQALRAWLEAEAAKGVATAKDLLSRIQ